MKFDYNKIKDPGYFRENRLDAHSSHKYYRSSSEAESGNSSFMYLQNICSKAGGQELALALMFAERKLRGKGAWRVHGGGFAGTILAFVPETLREEFQQRMDAVFGDGCCHFLNIRDEGGRELVYA